MDTYTCTNTGTTYSRPKWQWIGHEEGYGIFCPRCGSPCDECTDSDRLARELHPNDLNFRQRDRSIFAVCSDDIKAAFAEYWLSPESNENAEVPL